MLVGLEPALQAASAFDVVSLKPLHMDARVFVVFCLRYMLLFIEPNRSDTGTSSVQPLNTLIVAMHQIVLQCTQH